MTEEKEAILSMSDTTGIFAQLGRISKMFGEGSEEQKTIYKAMSDLSLAYEDQSQLRKLLSTPAPVSVKTVEDEKVKTGIELIAIERQEQVNKHKWDSGHDHLHRYGELAKVAAILAIYHTDATVQSPDEFKTGENIWGLEEKLKGDDIHRLKVAGALIAAEIDRLQLNTPSLPPAPVKAVGDEWRGIDSINLAQGRLEDVEVLFEDGSVIDYLNDNWPFALSTKWRFKTQENVKPVEGETITGVEEAAKDYVKQFSIPDQPIRSEIQRNHARVHFIEGAKWQAQQAKQPNPRSKPSDTTSQIFDANFDCYADVERKKPMKLEEFRDIPAMTKETVLKFYKPL